MEEYGYPPKFPEEETDPGMELEENVIDPADPTKRVKKVKSKVAAKGGGATYQWMIMKGLGMEDEEIKKFADPHYWLSYFPPRAKSDLQALGCRVRVLAVLYASAYILVPIIMHIQMRRPRTKCNCCSNGVHHRISVLVCKN